MKFKALAMVIVMVAAPAVAHDGATGVVKHRMEAMKTLGAQMKVLMPMANGNGFDEAGFEAAATALIAASKSLPAMFPTGSLSDVSEASPAIWEKPDAFQAELNQLITRAEAVAAADEFDLMDAMSALGQSCKSCHTAFRVKK